MTADDIPAVFGQSQALLLYNSPAYQVVSVASQLRAAGTYIWFYCSASDELAGQDQDFDAELAVLEIPHYFLHRIRGAYLAAVAGHAGASPQALRPHQPRQPPKAA